MGKKSSPEAPDYAPLAEANTEAARLQFEAAENILAENRRQFDELRPLYEADLAQQQELRGQQISSLEQQRGLLDKNEDRSAEQYDKFEQTIDMTNPGAWARIGDESLGRLQQGLSDGSYTPKEFSFSGQEALNDDPGYQFRKREGEKSIERALNARGLTGGAAAKELTRYGQDYASNEYGAAFNRAEAKYNYDSKRKQAQFLQDSSMASGAQGQLLDVARQRANMSNQRDPTGGYGANAAGYGTAGQSASAALSALGGLYSGQARQYANNMKYGAEAQGSGAIGAANAGIMGQQAQIDRWRANQQNRMELLGTAATAAKVFKI